MNRPMSLSFDGWPRERSAAGAKTVTAGDAAANDAATGDIHAPVVDGRVLVRTQVWLVVTLTAIALAWIVLVVMIATMDTCKK